MDGKGARAARKGPNLVRVDVTYDGDCQSLGSVMPLEKARQLTPANGFDVVLVSFANVFELHIALTAITSLDRTNYLLCVCARARALVGMPWLSDRSS